MGEVQGTVWTTLVFVTIFFGLVAILFWALDLMNYNSTVYMIEDNIRAGNYIDDEEGTYYDVTKTVDDRFNACGTVYDTNDDCTGIIEINEDKRYVKYQVSFNGVMMHRDASSDDDMLVRLPY
ncbi:hypothetical protein R2F61_04685 [Mollicutes bacterium LVI A0078]|nr:hypothetical protein RZE84_04705 [Mollicutes bacterium LVI A0075]WOO91842.1 hypothetical protein R2F61_04685 [Mollicutes bacterium LVI A0078]